MVWMMMLGFTTPQQGALQSLGSERKLEMG